ncbi:hypothetical protein Q7C36_012186 [Tachysurus vachellii]|uniref:Uncharacterized protein n=1 Tax=Tachysurus vachellii TaxID=175792 RepID=A0AA88MPL0_TACVA|nr:hypothetical protein Q7C36_012186 [Tachysurus vachellii]
MWVLPISCGWPCGRFSEQPCEGTGSDDDSQNESEPDDFNPQSPEPPTPESPDRAASNRLRNTARELRNDSFHTALAGTSPLPDGPCRTSLESSSYWLKRYQGPGS